MLLISVHTINILKQNQLMHNIVHQLVLFYYREEFFSAVCQQTFHMRLMVT
jgi:hypothetical protein